jgi:2-methylisocitrate lyase-like PEP mutase family enzyme
MGDAEVILQRLSAYIEAGASKFILRPIADGDAEMLAQTKRLVEEVLPQVASRWPRQRKVAA